MERFGNFIAKHRIIILIIAIVLLLPSIYGTVSTKINYDILTYLPEDLNSMQGQKILDETFQKAATGMLIVEDMEKKDVLTIKEKIEKVNGVESVTWISDLLDITVPKEMLPEDIREVFYRENSTLMMIQFKEGGATEATQQSIANIRKIMNKQCFLSGMSAIIKDTIELADRDTPIYVALAVILAIIVLALTLESTIVPIIFMVSIGMGIAYNFGSNIFLGEISYITKSLAAVLQLGVTMDFSIFLLHRYEDELRNTDDKNHAMARAISNTASSIFGSSLTTIAGFLALGIMNLGIGKDIGIVMAKGVLIGVICTITLLPALILVFDKVIHRFNHGTVLPSFNGVSNFITNHYKLLIILIIVLFIPAFYGQSKTDVYYNLDESLPKDMASIEALNKLKEEYDMTTTHMIIIDDDVKNYKVNKMIKDIEDTPGIEKVLGFDKFIGPSIPQSFIPDEIKETFVKGGYKLLLVNSEYRAATDQLNTQIAQIKDIVHKYDKNGMITGEGALTKDLVEIADVDFKRVSIASITAVFAIILLLFMSISIPIILVQKFRI